MSKYQKKKFVIFWFGGYVEETFGVFEQDFY